MNGAQYWIETLGLEPHPEGGYFRQTYKSELLIAHEALPQFGGPRSASTAIYFLLKDDIFSAFHRLRSDEMWHFYAGSVLAVHVIDPDGAYSLILLGNDLEAGQVFQAVVRAGCWFGAELARNPQSPPNSTELVASSYALVGCTVAPGFEFEDFELAPRGELEARYPGHREIIRRLTRR